MGLIERLLGGRGSAAVADLIRRDKWSIAEGQTETGIAVIRFRTPVLSGRDVSGHGRVVKIFWAYAEEGTGALPERPEREAMQTFEDRLIEAIERDVLAVLAAVFTYDGTRQWVVYAADARECAGRVERLPRDANPYPIEVTTGDDPGWRYLHDEILRNVPWKK